MIWLRNLYTWLREELGFLIKDTCFRCWHPHSQHVSDGTIADCAGENFDGSACKCVYKVGPMSGKEST
jgi:hypothetical protein